MMPILLLNTTIASGLPAAGEADSVYAVSAPISVEDARAALVGLATDSAIGHEATAAALTAILGRDVPVCRRYAQQAPGQRALCLKIRGRLPEGAILDGAAMEAIGYELRWLTRVA